MAFPIIPYHDWVRMGQSVTLEDGRMFYVHKGKGTPILMVRSFGMDSWWFCRVLAPLAEHFSVYAIDLPGSGQSETPPLPYDIPDFAEALREFMDKLGIEKAHVLGAGGGAMVCIHFAATRQPRVDKLILESLPHWTKAEAKTLWREKFRPKFLDENEQLKPVEQWGSFAKHLPSLTGEEVSLGIQRLQQEYREHGRWWLSMLTVGQLRYEVYTRLPLIESPTLLINGSEGLGEGESYHRRGEEKVVRSIKKSRLEIIPSTGVLVAFERPDLYSRLVLDFLRTS